jgi:hypothetical protein
MYMCMYIRMYARMYAHIDKIDILSENTETV